MRCVGRFADKYLLLATPDAGLALYQCWASVADAAPALRKRLTDVPYLSWPAAVCYHDRASQPCHGAGQ